MNVGDFVSVISRSGAGKSTFVKLLLGFEECEIATNGHLQLGGIDMKYRANGGYRTVEDIVAYVAQRPVLLPHWTVEQNVLFGVRQQLRYATSGTKKNSSDVVHSFYHDYLKWLIGVDNVSEWRWLQNPPNSEAAFNSPLGLLIRFMGLSDKMESYPAELSGGEAQRVHLLRWLVLARPILVLDEAFSALDQPLKGMVRDAIRRHTKALGISVINISHDRADVLQVSDLVFFVDNNRVIENATPRQLFFAPTTKDLAEFLGHTNLFQVQYFPENLKLVFVQRDVYRDVPFPEPERLQLDQDVSVLYIDRPGDKPRIAQAVSLDAARRSGILFIPGSDVNVTAIENGKSIQGENVFKIESMRFTGTHYDMSLVRESGGNAFRINAIVQDDDLMKHLPRSVSQDFSQDHLIGKRVAVSLRRGVILPPVGGT